LLLGMGLRMAAVLGATVVVCLRRPDLGLVEFFVWLILFYLVTLAVETRLLLADEQLRRPASRTT
jgi:hypothetical protein